MVSNEVDVGYKVSVSKVMNAKGVANNDGDFSIYEVDSNNVIESNTQYLVTLDVNGVNKLYRELWTSGDADDNNVVPLGDYTFTMDEYSINGLTEDDAVVLRFEEVEVKTSDAFRAAVSKTAPKSEGGSGGGVLVVTDMGGTLDKTWQEIYDADYAVVLTNSNVGKTFALVSAVITGTGYDVYCFYIEEGGATEIKYEAASASQHPSVPNGEA